jgi:hypothetical protein
MTDADATGDSLGKTEVVVQEKQTHVQKTDFLGQGASVAERTGSGDSVDAKPLRTVLVCWNVS